MEGRRFHLLLSSGGFSAWLFCMSAIYAVLLPTDVYAADLAKGNQPNQSLPLDEAIVQPEVERREIGKVAIDSENLELGVYGGLYSADRYGTNRVTGVRVGYHISEDLFFEVTAGETTLDELPEDSLLQYYTIPESERGLSYYNINLGYNLLPGEVFFGKDWAFNFAFYLLAGVGNTQINGEQRSTLTTGVGMRILFTDWMALHFNIRDHILRDRYSAIGDEQTIHNLEGLGSLTFFF